jgi:hypothetical protein
MYIFVCNKFKIMKLLVLILQSCVLDIDLLS